MPDSGHYDILIIGSGEAGKWLAWTMGAQGHRIAVVERKLIGGSCPNIACLPSKNIIHSAKVRSFTRRAAEFGVDLESAKTNMAGVQARKRAMVDGERQSHLDRYRATGVDLIMGEARFTGPRTVDVELNDGGSREISGERMFLDLGTHATRPDVPGLADARPMTHIELLDLDRLPEHLLVIGGGYVGLELAQAMRRFGAAVTVVEFGPQVARREDADVSAAIRELFRDQGITVHLRTEVRSVRGESGTGVQLVTSGPDGEGVIEGTDLLIGVGRTPNTAGIGLERAGVKVTETGYIAVDEHLATSAPGVWAMEECAGSPVHARGLRRLPRGVRRPHRRQPGHRRALGAVRHVHRPRACPGRLERDRGEAPRHRVPPAHDADGGGAPYTYAVRAARVPEDADRGGRR